MESTVSKTFFVKTNPSRFNVIEHMKGELRSLRLNEAFKEGKERREATEGRDFLFQETWRRASCYDASEDRFFFPLEWWVPVMRNAHKKFVVEWRGELNASERFTFFRERGYSVFVIEEKDIEALVNAVESRVFPIRPPILACFSG